MQSHLSQRGFTLIEIMVALMVLSILMIPLVNQKANEFQDDIVKLAVGEINDLFQSAQNYAAENNGDWPDEATLCANAISTLDTAGFLSGFAAASPYGNNYVTSCTTGAGKRFEITLDTGSSGKANRLKGYLPSTTVTGNSITVSVPLPASIPAFDSLLPRDGSREMTGDLDMDGNSILNAENLEFDGMGATAAQGIYFAGIVGNNQLINIPTCPSGFTPTPIVVPAGMSDNGKANAIGAVYAWADQPNASQWRARLRIHVYRNGNWVATQPNATYGKLAVYMKCS